MDSSITWGKHSTFVTMSNTHNIQSLQCYLSSVLHQHKTSLGSRSKLCYCHLLSHWPKNRIIYIRICKKKNWFKVHCTSHLMTYETENLQCKLLAFTTGYPICLVQVVITSRTGFPLAFPRDSHRSSVTAFLYLNFVRYWFIPFLKLWKTIKSFCIPKGYLRIISCIKTYCPLLFFGNSLYVHVLTTFPT